MNLGKKRFLFILTLACMLATAGMLSYMRAHQRLGPPGVRTSPTDDPKRLHVDLPQLVLDYTSKEEPIDKVVLDFLPKDTSFGSRRYEGPDRFEVIANVVLMGTDRTSLHKPQFCLAGTGWNVDYSRSHEDKIHMTNPIEYDLPVMKLFTTKQMKFNGQEFPASGIYVYWFVDDRSYTAQHWQRMWWMARDFLRTGVLHRWAYITFFAACPPGQEQVTYERMRKLIAAAVPEFQLPPRPVEQAMVK